MRKIYFDTNVLLQLYLYPREKIELLLSILEENYGDDIVIPFRVLFEFDKNRKEYLAKNFKTNLLSNVESEVHGQENEIAKCIKSLKNKKGINSFNTDYDVLIAELEKKTKEIFSRIFKQIDNCKSEYKSSYSDTDDPINDFKEAHASIKKYTNAQLLDLTNLYDTRVKCGIGPGKTDAGKKSSKHDLFARAGDFIIWKEMLENNYQADAITFITNETKQDYWGNDGKIDDYLESEFIAFNPGKRIDIILFFDFLVDEVFPRCSEHTDLISFFTERRNEYRAIFDDKDFVDGCIDWFYDPKNIDIDKHASEAIDGYNIDFFYDTDVTEANIISNKEDILLEYDYEQGLIRTYLSVEVKGKSDLEADCGHFDGELITDQFSIEFAITFDVVAIFEFDGQNVSFESIDGIKEKSFEITKSIHHGFDDADGCFGETCVDCGDPIAEENYGDGTRCYHCMIKNDDKHEN